MPTKIPGDLSLREAIIQSNATPGPNTIVVPAGTYKLTIAGSGETAGQTGDLDITNSVTIQGAGSASTIINGNSLDRVFYVLGSGSTVPVVSISGVTIEGGRAPDSSSLGPNNGGGIEVSDATLTVDQSVIENNRTGNGGSYAGRGGGINVQRRHPHGHQQHHHGEHHRHRQHLRRRRRRNLERRAPAITISNVHDQQQHDGNGTRAATTCRPAAAAESTVKAGDDPDISNSTITGNISGSSASYGEGGGIYNYVGSTLSLDNSTVCFNTASHERRRGHER